MNEICQYCTFVVADLYLGVDVLRVQEVIRFQRMTPVPLAHTVVEGLINLRGQIVTAVDLRRRLGLVARPEGRHPMNVVIRAEDGCASLLVDEVGDVVEVDAEKFERPPESLRGVARELVMGVYQLPKRLLLVVDPDKAMALPLSASRE